GQQGQEHAGQGGGRNDRPVPAGPLARPLGQRRPAGADRLVLQEALQVVGQLAGGGVALVGVLGQRLEDDRLQLRRQRRVEAARAERLLEGDLPQQLLAVAAAERRLQRQQLVEGGAQRVD